LKEELDVRLRYPSVEDFLREAAGAEEVAKDAAKDAAKDVASRP
jgi:hypothetical protein